MAKLTFKIAIPIILAGFFAIVVFIAAGYEKLEQSLYVIILLFIIYIFFFGLSVGQNLSSPVKKILSKATELSKGNLSSRVYLETKDELSELAKIFNKIAEELETCHAQGSEAEKSVGIKVKARTKELEETINALQQKVENRTVELKRLIDESNSLQESMKNKEGETVQLRKELDDFKQKIARYNKPKQKNIDNADAGDNA